MRLLYLSSLLLLALFHATDTSALTSTALPVPARTHTFKSYLQDPALRDLVPVFVSTALRLEGVYCQDDIKQLNGGGGLALGHGLKTKKTKVSLYTIQDVFQSPRRANAYKNIGTGSPDPYFAFKQEAGKVRLMVNMKALDQYYTLLSSEGRRRELWRQGGTKNTNGFTTAVAKRHNQTCGFYYDPSGADKVTPYWPGLTPAEVKRIERCEATQEKWDRRYNQKAERAWARYDRWVAKQLGLSKGETPRLTDTELDKYYINPTNKKYPYKYASAADGGGYVHKSSTSVAGTAGADGDDVEIDNYTVTSYLYDYAIIFAGPDGVRQRLDLTIVPKVFRTTTPHTGFLCMPDGSKDPVELSSFLTEYIPRTDTCASHTSRSAPYALSSPNFATLHPEEADWLSSRLDKTAPLVKKFVEDRLPGKTLDINTEARLKIAFSNTGGGKRSMMHSLGVTQALYKLGIFDHASWVSGLSGGGWYLSAHYLAMLDKLQTVEPKKVFEDIKDRITNSFFGDEFEMNEAFTNALVFTFNTPVAFPSRIGENNITSEVLCEGEIKLQSPLTYSERSASSLEYWARSVTSQVTPSSSSDVRGYSLTLSSFATKPLLSSHSGPLPLYQIQENKGDGSNFFDFRLWEVSPFDVTTNEGSLHASFPTSLLGSSGQSTDTCTVGLDNFAYVHGISSYALVNSPSTEPVCAVSGLSAGQETICQATGMPNMFEGFAGVGATDLSSKPDLFLTDGGLNCIFPIWMFLSPTRQADIVFAIDGGGSEVGAQFSTDTIPDPTTCPADAAQIRDGTCKPWPGTSCCNSCITPPCFSTNIVGLNNLFYTLSAYEARMPANTAPPYPKADGSNFNPNDPKSKFGQRVLIFGCDDVSTKTPIVLVPNRIVVSGQGGHSTARGSLNLKVVPFALEDAYGPDDLDAFFQNGEASLPSLPGLTDFPKCMACLYYAKANGQDDFMRSDSDCSECYDNYCWVPSS